jgi:hypothetical protein
MRRRTRTWLSLAAMIITIAAGFVAIFWFYHAVA